MNSKIMCYVLCVPYMRVFCSLNLNSNESPTLSVTWKQTFWQMQNVLTFHPSPPTTSRLPCPKPTQLSAYSQQFVNFSHFPARICVNHWRRRALFVSCVICLCLISIYTRKITNFHYLFIGIHKKYLICVFTAFYLSGTRFAWCENEKKKKEKAPSQSQCWLFGCVLFASYRT